MSPSPPVPPWPPEGPDAHIGHGVRAGADGGRVGARTSPRQGLGEQRTVLPGRLACRLGSLAVALVGLASLTVASPNPVPPTPAPTSPRSAPSSCAKLRHQSFLHRTPAFVEDDYLVASCPPARPPPRHPRPQRGVPPSRHRGVLRRLRPGARRPGGHGLLAGRGAEAQRLAAPPGRAARLLRGDDRRLPLPVVPDGVGPCPHLRRERLLGHRVVATSRTLVAADLIYTLEARRKTVVWSYYNELFVDVDTASRDYWAERPADRARATSTCGSPSRRPSTPTARGRARR